MWQCPKLNEKLFVKQCLFGFMLCLFKCQCSYYFICVYEAICIVARRKERTGVRVKTDNSHICFRTEFFHLLPKNRNSDTFELNLLKMNMPTQRNSFIQSTWYISNSKPPCKLKVQQLVGQKKWCRCMTYFNCKARIDDIWWLMCKYWWRIFAYEW